MRLNYKYKSQEFGKLFAWFLNITIPGRRIPVQEGTYDLRGKEILFLARYQTESHGSKQLAKELGVSFAVGNRFVRDLGLPVKAHSKLVRGVRIRTININTKKVAERLIMEGYISDAYRWRNIESKQYKVYAQRFNCVLQSRRRWANRDNDPQFKIKHQTRNVVARICRVIKTKRRALRTRTFEFLGCDYETAQKHIASQFRPGMTWANHGDTWEVDHIRPLASFDLTDHNQRLAACHYTNLQPLTPKENRAKAASEPLLR